MNDNHVTVSISFATIVKTALFILLIGALFYMRDLVIVLLTSVVLASATEPATRFLGKLRIPRPLAVGIIFAFLIGLVLMIIYVFLPPFIEQFSQFVLTIPKFVEQLNTYLKSPGPSYFAELDLFSDFLRQLKNADMVDTIKSALFASGGGIANTAGVFFNGFTQVFVIGVLSFYLAVQERGIENFLRVVTPLKSESYVIDLWNRSQEKIGRWMQGQLILGVIIGILVYLGLCILGLQQYALLLGILAAFCELIPLFGAIISMLPGIFVGFIDGGVTLGLMVLGFYIIVQQIESNIIYPLVVKKLVGVPSLLVILSLLIGGNLLGFWGLILAVPFAAAIMEFVDDVQKNKEIKVRDMLS